MPPDNHLIDHQIDRQMDDQLIIETPEQTAVEFPLAGVGSRGLALAIDTLLHVAGWIALGLLAAWIDSEGYISQAGKQWGAAILTLAFFVLDFGYYAFFEIVWNGQTPGKRWTHLRVIDDSGRPLGVQQAILRNLLRIVDFLPVLYTVGIVAAFLSPQHKRIGDYLAGTVVVHQLPLEQGAALWSVKPVAASPIVQASPLTVAELELVEAFLERRAGLAPDVRALVAREVAERLGQRCSVPPEARLDSEKFLELLAEQGRGSGRLL